MAKRKLSTGDVATDWESEEKLQLLGAMKAQCPGSDRLSFSARLNRVDWEKVRVEGRSAEQCQEAWHQMLARVRKFRTLDEVMEDAKDMVTHPEKYPDKKHKVKHPDQPVKPLTAYFQFVKQNREAMKAQHPELNNIQLTRLFSRNWQALEPEKQNKYIRRYKKQWAKFQEANAKFLEEHPELNNKQAKPRPPTPFSAFIKAKMPSLKEKHPEMDNIAVQRKLRHKYMKLGAEKKRKWIQRALESVPEYEEEVRLYQRLHPNFEPPAKKVRLTKEEAVLNGNIIVSESHKGSTHSKKIKFPGAPEKPPRSAFQLFVKRRMGRMEGGMKEKMQVLGQEWQALGDRRHRYTKRLDRLRRRYAQHLHDFRETLTPEELTAFEDSLKPQKKTSPTRKEKVEASSGAESPSRG